MSLFSVGKRLLNRYPSFLVASSKAYNFIGFNKTRKKGKMNRVECNKSFLYKTKAKIIGSNNSIQIGNICQLKNCTINIYGNNNRIIIGDNVYLKDAEFHIEDDYNEINIGNKTTIFGKTHFACIEGRKIVVGDDCMFSADVVFRTGDSHSITDNNGNRINASKDIIIGNHVWFGNRTIIIKGVHIADNSIIGTGSVVTKAFFDVGVVLVGNPARIVKRNVNWLRERI
ncbi:MAG: acyltransferase [Eubacteriales bacterium]